MHDYWTARSGRWRRSMRLVAAPSLAERLYQVIRADVEAGQLPAGALLPAKGRIAAQLTIDPVDVQAAYARLSAEGIVESRAGGELCIMRNGHETAIGDSTQMRFEASLIKAVRAAAAYGLGGDDGSGLPGAPEPQSEEVDRK
jgi:DNA-binding transcriptional regulator YhcF (GntR family)